MNREKDRGHPWRPKAGTKGKEKQRRKRIDEDEDKHATNGPWVSEDKEGGQEKGQISGSFTSIQVTSKEFRD